MGVVVLWVASMKMSTWGETNERIYLPKVSIDSQGDTQKRFLLYDTYPVLKLAPAD